MFLLVIVVMVFFSITTVCYSLHYGITPMPSSHKAKKALFDLLPSSVVGTILELGAGFGSLAIPLAKKYPNQVIAYEISPFPYLVLKTLKYLLRLKNLKVVRRDFYKCSFTEAGLCVSYLYPAGMQKLTKKFQRELKGGAFIASNAFCLPGWRAVREANTSDLYDSKIFLYQMPF